jgi:hypothetical protein
VYRVSKKFHGTGPLHRKLQLEIRHICREQQSQFHSLCGLKQSFITLRTNAKFIRPGLEPPI